MLLKEEVGGSALNSHGNYIADLGKSWKNHGIMFLNFCGNPEEYRNLPLNFEFENCKDELGQPGPLSDPLPCLF